MLKSKTGQTTIELLILLSISMVALTIIFSIYIDQVNSSFNNQDYFLAKSSVQKIVSAANTVYYAGAGSEIKLELEFPRDVDFSSTGFFGQEVLVKLKNGHSYVGGADINIVGQLKPYSGKNIIYMLYDGNVVKIHYNDFETNRQNVSISALQGQSVSTNFTIRNNSMQEMKFYLDKNFSHNFVYLDNLESSFDLAPAEVKQISLDFTQSSSAQGNYSGFITITGQVNDLNFSRTINISLEVLTKSNELVIYPKINSFSSSPLSVQTKSFSICNSSQDSIIINSWAANGSIDKNAAEWISELPIITSVSPRDCNDFDLIFTIPSATVGEVYDANISAILTDSNRVSSNIYILIN
jgi:hypothetical protein